MRNIQCAESGDFDHLRLIGLGFGILQVIEHINHFQSENLAAMIVFQLVWITIAETSDHIEKR